MIQRLVLLLVLLVTVAACNRDNVSIRPDEEGNATVTITLSEGEFNTMLTTALSNTANPLLRDPHVDFQNGQIEINGEHDRRDGNGRVAGTLTATLQVVNAEIGVQITEVNIEGIDATDEQVAALNQRLSEWLAGRARRDHPRATLDSITITDDAVEINITVSRASQ